MAEIEVKMPIDPFKVVRRALSSTHKKFRKKIVGLSYDEEADVLYVKFSQAKVVDNKPLDADGMLMASLDEKKKVIGIIVMDASKYQ